MRGLQPSSLTNEELLKYATMARPEDVPPEWVAELLKRFEELLDDKLLMY